MATTSSAKKSARKTIRQTAVNRIRRSRLHTFIRKVEEAITGGNKDGASVALREAESEIMRAASKGMLHRNTASRKVSRLTARVRAL